jgi:spore maturation protein CgeB
MKLFVFGSSITSSYWNGAATYYRGIYRNLHELGFQTIFAEPDIYNRQQNRDLAEVSYAEVLVYQTPRDLPDLLDQACTADLVIKHSGVGADDELLEREVLACRSGNTRVAFWDVDAPATLARLENDSADYFRSIIPGYDYVFTYGGGSPVVEHYLRLGAKNCHPIYNALDPQTHHPVPKLLELECDLAFVGNRLPDRERRVEEFFLRAAELAPELKFILGGEGWGSRPLPKNVRWIGHVGTADHNRVNCSARMILNINRESMANVGFSPPTRVFEAAGAGACLITDAWTGIEQFFLPGEEILVASLAEDVVHCLRHISAQKAQAIGAAMRSRALRDHTYALRAREFQQLVGLEAASSRADASEFAVVNVGRVGSLAR